MRSGLIGRFSSFWVWPAPALTIDAFVGIEIHGFDDQPVLTSSGTALASHKFAKISVELKFAV